ncbi:MAG: hypothetical protein ACYDBI_05910 [Thermoplasmataceae archaeon]
MDDQLWRIERDAEAPTRRERFAMAAMQGLLPDPECGLEPELLAKEAVLYADALIAELEKEKE